LNRKKFISTIGLGSSALVAAGCRNGKSSEGALSEFNPESPGAFWKSVQNAYQISEDRVYLNCGGLGPSPRVVNEAVKEKLEALQRVSETGHSIMDKTREVAAQYFGAHVDELCFTRNATESNSIIAAGVAMKPGDEVIFESHAHPGGSFPWLGRQKREGIRVKIFEPDPESSVSNVERIQSLITPRTRAIQVSHITAPTGILFDVQAIGQLARDRGIWFHVDGAQTAGMIPIDLTEMKCDSYATSGHKWMGGPRGTGVLYIQKDRIDEVACLHLGAYSDAGVDLPNRIDLHPTVRRHEYGTRNTELVEGLRVAMEFQEQIGKERIETYGRGLASYLRKGLLEIDGISVLTPSDPAWRRSIITFKSDRVGFDDLNNQLMREYRLRCRRVTERGLDAVRVSTHLFNSEADCDRVVEAVRAIVA